MQLDYDPATDVLRIVLRRGRVERCEDDGRGVVRDYAAGGALVAFCIQEASRNVDNPRAVDVAVSGRNIRGLRM